MDEMWSRTNIDDNKYRTEVLRLLRKIAGESVEPQDQAIAESASEVEPRKRGQKKGV